MRRRTSFVKKHNMHLQHTRRNRIAIRRAMHLKTNICNLDKLDNDEFIKVFEEENNIKQQQYLNRTENDK